MTHHFTNHRDERVDKCVLQHLDQIRKLLVDRHPAVCSLILVGSFGRGEGSALLCGQDVAIVNDYDVVVISDGGAPLQLQDDSTELAERLGVRFVDLIPIPRQRLTSLPYTMFHFDLKHGGFPFHGVDSRDAMPYMDPARMPISEAWIVFFNRLLSLLEAFPDDMKPSNELFIYTQSSKAILACVDVALITNGRFATLYAEKNKRFSKLDVLRDYVEIVAEATRFKLDPAYHVRMDGRAFWATARRMYLETYDLLQAFAGDRRYSRSDVAKDLIKRLIGRPTRRRIMRLEELQVRLLRLSDGTRESATDDATAAAVALGCEPIRSLRGIREFSVRMWYELKH